MKLISVNISLPRTVSVAGKDTSTAIFKEPVHGRIQVRTLSLEGDGQADLENHGGIYKAVYSYPFEHYDNWAQQLNRRNFVFGQFGENLTVEGLTEEQVHIGDVFRIGEVLLEVTQPRVPCFKLAHKMQLPQFPKLFAASGRVGYYQRVLAEGEIGAGDTIERVKAESGGMTVRALMELMYFDRTNVASMEKAIAIPALTPSWREELQDRLSAINGDTNARKI
jgi:MOSC domain-containing protein YiiM